jgi:hypothetical protein
MVKTIHGLKRVPGVPSEFGSERRPCLDPIEPGDEVRCMRGNEAIYLRIRGAGAAGCLLGEVVAFGPTGFASGPGLGDLVDIPTNRILVVLRADPERGSVRPDSMATSPGAVVAGISA